MLKIVKIGGNIVEDPGKIDKFLSDFASLKGDKILVHGGGVVATDMLKKLGYEPKMHLGRRITNPATLRVVTSVYAGVINKSIVAKLQKLGVNAIGLSGADGGFILSKRRSTVPINYGLVGDPTYVDTTLTRILLDLKMTIVAAPITLENTGSGQLLNTNADTVASAIAGAMAEMGVETELIYCFEERGVLLDMGDEDSVIPSINRNSYASLKDSGAIFGGMLPKLDNAFKAIDKGVARVVICSAGSILEPGCGGTTLQ